jgi:hypothetical protein
VTDDYLHVGVCVPVGKYRYRIFDTHFTADFGNAHDRECYALPFYLFLQELFDSFDVNCLGIVLSDFRADKDLYEGKIYPRQVLSSRRVFGRINWVQKVLERRDNLDRSYVAKDCGRWVENMQRVFLELGDNHYD